METIMRKPFASPVLAQDCLRRLLRSACGLVTLSTVLMAGRCATPGGPFATIVANAPNITNDLSLACHSAEQLLGLPKAAKATGRMATAVSNLDAKVTKYCNAAITDAPTVTTTLGVVNTAAAALLGFGVAL
jgi:hypothetical protein